ncbi:unnamed protein product [Lactuca saligna]|uniref:Uncharacterized protein n=1 Tax=Lactuca saligna TaxID=75948 RepID=A0AA35Z074_LACSI|nr:unnamed protein product [Lactuca saligna]
MLSCQAFKYLPGILPSAAEYRRLEATYSLSSLEGVEFPAPGSSISSPPPDKIGVLLKTLDAGICFPLTDFQEEVYQKDGCSLKMLTPNAVNKIVAFEMICRANAYLPDYFVFKFFFRFCVTNDKYTFSVRRGGHALVPNGRTPKNWQEKWLWVNQGLVGSGRYRANAFADTIPKLFPHNQGVADYLKSVQCKRCSFGGSEGTPESVVGQEIMPVVGNGKDGKAVGEGDRGAETVIGDGDAGEIEVGAGGNVGEVAPESCATPSGVLKFLCLVGLCFYAFGLYNV